VTVLKFILTILAGIALGFLATTRVLDRGITLDVARAGPWIGHPKTGTTDIDPYENASIARTAELPLGSAEGLSFIARTDSQGQPLRPECDYKVSGSVPPTRYWTLTLISPKGFLIDNKARRFGFTSAEVVRAADGTFTINVARDARPGNWLPVGSARAYALMLRLYDTLLDFGTTQLGAAALPKIERGGCA
jgi:hypothetical protein